MFKITQNISSWSIIHILYLIYVYQIETSSGSGEYHGIRLVPGPGGIPWYQPSSICSKKLSHQIMDETVHWEMPLGYIFISQIYLRLLWIFQDYGKCNINLIVRVTKMSLNILETQLSKNYTWCINTLWYCW